MRKKYANMSIFNFCLRINDTIVRFCRKNRLKFVLLKNKG